MLESFPGLRNLIDRYHAREFTREILYSELKSMSVPHDHPALEKELLRSASDQKVIEDPQGYVAFVIKHYRKYLEW
ncbi:MAG TPA: hypothetical protein VI874_04300 [Candidatus Norongarragalinales archaeon]|nr:hypothetical protein [Candidatus Norongarragalinales archaeon]